MRVRRGGDASAGIWLNQDGADRGFVGLLDDTRVGLWGSGIGWGLTMDTNSGVLGAVGGGTLNGVTASIVGAPAPGDPGRMAYSFPYETIGVAQPGMNLRAPCAGRHLPTHPRRGDEHLRGAGLGPHREQRCADDSRTGHGRMGDDPSRRGQALPQ